ncbi:DUF2163 domain-containing protein [uncultured Alsobacter sp.]|uniref:DUF2163 domain-containing protein n=1 Tax=uncultured Alsobacter sp. TaxID=1748258 RepID=UPI0025FA72B7|nr:DUF2163 domain-containing protein [uncultured Alsobacter sp.]
MRDLPSSLREAFASGVTTLARCWTLRRRDGTVLGFTDHDRDLDLGGVVHAAGTGLEGSDMHGELGFAVGGGDVSGALTAPGLAEDDLAAGLWDDARVELWLVDWQAPQTRVLLDVGTIGEVRRAGAAFVAEMRGLAHRLDLPRGRLYQARCDADLGDARCGVDLADPRWSATGWVAATDGVSWFTATGLEAYADGLFNGGRVTFAQGGLAGQMAQVQLHRHDASVVSLTLWEPAPRAIEPGMAFTVSAGCDGSLGSCTGRFGNLLNFRGFPHMPGSDYVLRNIRTGDGRMDGGSLLS